MLNEAKRKPLYQPWNEEAFRADLHVGAMTPTQRWIYRTLLQAAFFHSTRPNLPDDDAQLWLLAGCENRKQWERNKDAVRAMFTPVEVDGERLLSQKRLLADWERIEEKRQILSENGRRGRKAQLELGNRPADAKQMAGNCPANAGQEKLREVEVKGREEKERTPAPKAGAKRSTPLLDGFQLDADMIVFANENGIEPQEEFARFGDYHRAKGSAFKDWTAAWRTWVRNAVQFRKEKGNGRTGSTAPKSFDAARNEGTDAALKRILDRARASAPQTRPHLPPRTGRGGNLDLHAATEGFAAGQN